MRAFNLPNQFAGWLMVGPLVIGGALATAAESGTSSVNFVSRDSLKSHGWTQSQGNPLRSNSVASGPQEGSKQATVPASALAGGNAAPSRNASGLQLRPHTPQTGIFSSWFGETAQPKKPLPNTQARVQSPGQSSTIPPKEAAARAMSIMPQFRSTSVKKQGSSTTANLSSNARAGSARVRPGQPMSQYTADRATTQAAYRSAADAAGAYRRSGFVAPAGDIPVQRKSGAVLSDSRPNFAAARATAIGATASPRPAATRPINASPNISSTAAILSEAHELAESARTEADFTNIFNLCQQIPASKATQEETVYGRQLAAWSLNRRGQSRARAGQNNVAMDDFNLAIRIDANCWRALHNRGVLLAQAGNFEQAFDDFQHTIEQNPNFAKAYSNRAALYVLAGELEPALADYQRAVVLDPKFAIAHRGCGRTCHLLGRTNEALEHFSRAIELTPTDAVTLANRADLLTDLGQYHAAASDYDRALAASPNNVEACRGSAWLLATCPDESVRNPDLALRRAKTATELGPQADVVTLDTLAAAQASTGDFEAAMQTIRQAIDLAPPSERSVYQDRMQMYRHATPFQIAPLDTVQQAGYEQ